MTQKKAQRDASNLKIHAIGGALCLAIAGGSVWFAADSIAKRRGLFLSARHELTAVRGELDQAVSQRGSLAMRVNKLEDATRDALKLSSSRHLNKRTAELSRIAESVEVSVDMLQPGDMVLDARVPVQPLSLVGTADASSVSDLLDELGNQMPDMHIQSIEMTTEALGSERVRLRLTLYWFVDPTGES